MKQEVKQEKEESRMELVLGILSWYGIYPKMKKRMNLQAGGCGARWSCKNINKEICNPLPEEGEGYVECEHYERS